MDDQNKKHPFDDFFQPEGGDEKDTRYKTNDDETAAGKGEASDASKTSYYYSYGPFKSGSDYEHTAPGPVNDGGPAAGGQVEMTPPQLRPFAPTQPAKGPWQVREKRGTSFKAIFASFMVGVVAVGGLMFAADRGNWFTPASASALAAPAGQASTAASSGGSGSVSTASDVVRPSDIAQMVDKTSPAVVKIVTYVNQQQSNQGNDFFNDPFFRQFFGDNGGQGDGNGSGGSGGQSTGNLVEEGMGSGFFFDSSGYILTNEHVIDGADKIEVTVEGRKDPLVAKKLGSSYDLDLAVLKVEGTGFPTLPIDNSDNNTEVGDWVVAIGNPYGFDHTVTVGVLSAKDRPIDIPDSGGTRHYQHLLQTDASINPGNSGGPLLNLQGQVIGINTAVNSQAQGIGFAIPSSTILEVLDNLKTNTQKPIPYLGVYLSDITDQLAQELGLSSKDGAVVANVGYKTPAYNADVRQYDVITGINGTKYKTTEQLTAAIQKLKVGDKATLNIIRNGRAMDLTVEIGDKNKYTQQ